MSPATLPDRPRSSLRVGYLAWRKPKPELPKMPGAFRPTEAHLVRWTAKHAPAWAAGLSLPVTGTDPDSLINARAGIKWQGTLHNALSLALLVRKNCETGARFREDEPRTLPDYLRAYKASYPSGEKARAAIFARWVRGLGRAAARLQKGTP